MSLAILIAYGLIAAASMLLVAALLGLACLAAWAAGTLLWRRICRIYRIATIWHYLEQLEKTGRYHFPKPDKDNPWPE